MKQCAPDHHQGRSRNTFMEIPLTVATLGVIAAPVLAAWVRSQTALSNFTVVVERADRSTGRAAAGSRHSALRQRGPGGYEGHVAQRIDSHGTKVEIWRRRRTYAKGG